LRNVRGDREPAHEEGSLVETASSQPGSDFLVPLAGVARWARRYDILDGVPPADRDGQDAVALERHAGGTAVGASSPGILERIPLRAGQVVLDACHSAATPAGVHGLSTSTNRHDNSLSRHWSAARSFATGHVRRQLPGIPLDSVRAAVFTVSPR
jgi:hypothetical protein